MKKNHQTGNKGVGRPKLKHSLTEGWRAGVQMILGHAFYKKVLKALPRGEKHSVMLLPGFGAPNVSMYLVKQLCEDLGYNPVPWNDNMFGLNLGPKPHLYPERIRDVLDISEQNLIDEYNRTGKKVSLIGQSLGGVFALYLAQKHPDKVKGLITLGSPVQHFDNPQGTAFAASFLFNLLNDQDIAEDVQTLLNKKNCVPTTHVYSTGDGVVNWKIAISSDITRTEETEDIEVTSAHVGQGLSPQSLLVIGDRLAQKENGWKPFNRWQYPNALFRSKMAHEKLANRYG